MPYTSVHCPDRETFDKLMQIYQDAGWVWAGGDQPTQWSLRGEWDTNEKIEVKNNFLRAKSPSYKTLSFPDFLTAQGLEETPEGVIRAKSLKAEDLKVGDWVEVVKGFKDETNGALGTYNGSHTFQVGEKYKYISTNVSGMMQVDIPNKGKMTLYSYNIANLRKCSPPEPKKEPFCKSQTCKIEAPSQNVRIQGDGTVFTADSADYKLNFPIPPTSLPPSRMSLMDAYRNSLLSADERKLRKAGVKDPYGTLTSDGKALLLEILAEKYKAELVKEAKKIIKARNGKDDEDAE